MKAVLILIASAIMAAIYKRLIIDRATGEQLMGCGPMVLLPFVIIAAAAVVALIIFT